MVVVRGARGRGAHGQLRLRTGSPRGARGTAREGARGRRGGVAWGSRAGEDGLPGARGPGGGDASLLRGRRGRGGKARGPGWARRPRKTGPDGGRRRPGGDLPPPSGSPGAPGVALGAAASHCSGSLRVVFPPPESQEGGRRAPLFLNLVPARLLKGFV